MVRFFWGAVLKISDSKPRNIRSFFCKIRYNIRVFTLFGDRNYKIKTTGSAGGHDLFLVVLGKEKKRLAHVNDGRDHSIFLYSTNVTLPISFALSTQPLVKPDFAKR